MRKVKRIKGPPSGVGAYGDGWLAPWGVSVGAWEWEGWLMAWPFSAAVSALVPGWANMMTWPIQDC